MSMQEKKKERLSKTSPTGPVLEVKSGQTRTNKFGLTVWALVSKLISPA